VTLAVASGASDQEVALAVVKEFLDPGVHFQQFVEVNKEKQ